MYYIVVRKKKLVQYNPDPEQFATRSNKDKFAISRFALASSNGV